MDAPEIYNTHEAKTHLSRLCAQAAVGEDVILARHGQPWVRITALSKPKKKIVYGLMKGEIEMGDDFNDELPPDVLESF